MNRIIHFEFNIQNPERTAQFFTDVFGWQIQKWDGPMEYWLVTTGDEKAPGINGGFARVQEGGSPETTNVVGVASIDEAVAKVAQHGGEILMPKAAIPGVGYFASCKDPEGIQFGLMQADPNAA